MTSTASVRAHTTPVDAYRTTGTSPGRPGSLVAAVTLDHAGRHEIEIRYEVHGPADAPPVVVLGGISADSHLAPTRERPEGGWWPGVIGAGGGLDPTRQRLVGIDYLAGPTTPVPSDEPVTSHDQARAIACVLDALGARSASLVGSSYGGLVALAFADLFPERVEQLVILCAAHRAHPMATGLRAIQRAIVKLGEESGRSEAGVILARALAMTTYRSTREFEERFDVRPSAETQPARFPVQEYLEAQGKSFASRFDVEAFYRLSESIDLHYIDPERVTPRTTLVSVDTDALAPPWLVEELAGRAPGVERHARLKSIYGHDAFLKEVDAVSEVLREALAS